MNKADYFSLYLGIYVSCQKPLTYIKPFVGKIVQLNVNGAIWVNTGDGDVLDHIDNCKLILRPLSDMTEDEALTATKIVHPGLNIGKATYLLPSMEWHVVLNGFKTNFVPNRRKAYYTAEQALYLIKQGFDIFGLHNKGFCIYKHELTTLNPFEAVQHTTDGK